MMIVVYEPGKAAALKGIENSLHGMQEVVGGYITTFRLGAPKDMKPGREFVLIVDEDGYMKTLAPNMLIGREVIVGTCFVAIWATKKGSADIVGLTNEEYDTWMQQGDHTLKRL